MKLKGERWMMNLSRRKSRKCVYGEIYEVLINDKIVKSNISQLKLVLEGKFKVVN
jgi:hypothetical protein